MKLTRHSWFDVLWYTIICLLVAFLVWALSSCKKETTPEPASRMELLTGKTWKNVSRGVDINNNRKIDGNESTILDCEKDDHFTFNRDNSGWKEDKTITCTGADQRIPYVWAFEQDESRLVFQNTIEWQILSLTEESLTLITVGMDGERTIWKLAH